MKPKWNAALALVRFLEWAGSFLVYPPFMGYSRGWNSEGRFVVLQVSGTRLWLIQGRRYVATGTGFGLRVRRAVEGEFEGWGFALELAWGRAAPGGVRVWEVRSHGRGVRLSRCRG